MTEEKKEARIWSAATATPSKLNIDKPGIYEMTKDEYHADPCKTPSLSRSAIVTMLEKSPYHMAFSHPRLGGGTLPTEEIDDHEEAEKMANAVLIGAVMDELLMPTGAEIHVSQFKTFASKDAKADRDAALALGKIVIKEKHYQTVLNMLDTFRRRFTLERFPEVQEEFPRSNFQKAVIWEEDGVWFRSMLDAVNKHIWDYKSSAANCHPDKWAKSQLFGMGLEIQAFMYPRGYFAATGERKHFVFAVQEQKEPHDCYPVHVDELDLAIAAEKFTVCKNIFREGLETGNWDGYTKRIHYASSPQYHKAAWEIIKEREKFLEKVQQVREYDAAQLMRAG